MGSGNEGHRIDGRARTVRELLDGAHYTIDFYQREYAWKRRQVQELIDDLSGKFLDFYEEAADREEVAEYGHYFLGSIVISHKRGQRFIVDGQQRLTTLTLLLIHLHHLQEGRPDAEPVDTLIYSKRYGKRSFNIDVDERTACLDKLFTGEVFDATDAKESVQNMVARYEDIESYFPEELAGTALPYFVDWLRENVHLVEIEAYSDEDAYTIFETMNDRGLSLSFPEMLKGYILANIKAETDQRRVNALWKERMQAFRELGEEEDVDFFKNWLRGRHAETARMVEKGTEHRDYERIGSEFHRWVRDQRERLGLNDSQSFVRFVERDLDFYARQALRIRKAARELTEGLEAIRFNEDRQFTTQSQVLLAALDPEDSKQDVYTKLKLVADYLDIWLARRNWSFRDTSQSTVRYVMFNLCRKLRGKSPSEVAACLREELLESEQFTFAKNVNLRLHNQNRRQVRHILARLTYWVDQECGVATHFDDLVSKGKGKPFEIEHLWPDRPERFAVLFEHPSDFEKARNRIGGLVLLQRGPNQSLGDLPFEKKRDAYVALGQSLLTRSLHPAAYQNNPAFRSFLELTGLEFQAHEQFWQDEQDARQELYVRIAEWVWNPSRLDLDGTKAPVAEPLVDPEDRATDGVERDVRYARRREFWTRVIAYSKSIGGIHADLTPSPYHWIRYRENGFVWRLMVRQTDTAYELIFRFTQEQNKAIFDRLIAHRSEVERAVGVSLEWQRRDDNIASCIGGSVSGGWTDEALWEGAIKTAVDRMQLLYAALVEPANQARKAIGA